MALAASLPAWSAGYTGDPSRSAQKFTPDGRWHLTCDVGSVDADGYYHFTARDDDVIIMAGYRIGRFDAGSVLCSDLEVGRLRGDRCAR